MCRLPQKPDVGKQSESSGQICKQLTAPPEGRHPQTRAWPEQQLPGTRSLSSCSVSLKRAQGIRSTL